MLATFTHAYLQYFIILNGLTIILAIFIGRNRQSADKKGILPFSIKNVYLLQVPFLLPAVMAAITVQNILPLLIFVLIGFMGMAAETIYSYYWVQFFSKPIWKYSLFPLFNGYTGGVNFLAWSVGGMLFLGIYENTKQYFDQEHYMNYAYLFLVIAAGATLVFYMSKILHREITGRRTVPFSLASYVLMSVPLLSAIIIPALFTDLLFIPLMVVYGIAAFVSEYLYGKYMKKMLGKKLWNYSYATIDNQHTSPTNFFGAIVAGVLFTWAFLIFM